jgi:hypothetical protein
MKPDADSIENDRIYWSDWISWAATTPPKEKENKQVDLINDNDIKSFEDLEDKCPCEHEQSSYSPILVSICDLDLKIQLQCAAVTGECDELQQQGAHVINNCDKLEQQTEFVIKSDSVKPNADRVLKTIAGGLDSLTVFHTGINTVAPIDAQYLWSDKYQPRKPRIFNKVYTSNDWNQYIKKYYDTDIEISY